MDSAHPAVILNVENDPAARYVVGRMLRSAGYEVVEAESGLRAMEVISWRRPDLIVLDVNMPGMGGLEVARRLKADPATRSIPILHLSATAAESSDVVVGLEGGADGYLTQPVEPSVVLATVKALLRARQGEAAAEMAAQQWLTTFNAIRDGVALLDSEGSLVRWNAGLSELVDEAESGQHCGDLAVSGNRIGVDALWQRLRETGNPVRDLLSVGDRLLDTTLAPIVDEAGEFTGGVMIAADVTERVRARERLLEVERARAELAEVLNREISHRVKNNLSMVAGMLQMQIASDQDPRLAKMLQDAIARLYAFASVHDQLTVTEAGEVELLAAVRQCAAALRRVFPRAGVAVSIEGDEVRYPGSTAANLSVVTNELITNALNHGSPGDDGQLRVDVRVARDGGAFRLSVWNSGNPVPADLDPNQQTGVGLRLVQGLVVGQYGGTFTLEPQDGGTLAQVLLSDERLREG